MATENMEHEKEHRSHEAFAGAPGSAVLDVESELRVLATVMNRAGREGREGRVLTLAAEIVARSGKLERVADAARAVRERHAAYCHVDRDGHAESSLDALIQRGEALEELEAALARLDAPASVSPNGCKLSDDSWPRTDAATEKERAGHEAFAAASWLGTGGTGKRLGAEEGD